MMIMLKIVIIGMVKNGYYKKSSYTQILFYNGLKPSLALARVTNFFTRIVLTRKLYVGDGMSAN